MLHQDKISRYDLLTSRSLEGPDFDNVVIYGINDPSRSGLGLDWLDTRFEEVLNPYLPKFASLGHLSINAALYKPNVDKISSGYWFNGGATVWGYRNQPLVAKTTYGHFFPNFAVESLVRQASMHRLLNQMQLETSSGIRINAPDSYFAFWAGEGSAYYPSLFSGVVGERIIKNMPIWESLWFRHRRRVQAVEEVWTTLESALGREVFDKIFNDQQGRNIIFTRRLSGLVANIYDQYDEFQRIRYDRKSSRKRPLFQVPLD